MGKIKKIFFTVLIFSVLILFSCGTERQSFSSDVPCPDTDTVTTAETTQDTTADTSEDSQPGATDTEPPETVYEGPDTAEDTEPPVTDCEATDTAEETEPPVTDCEATDIPETTAPESEPSVLNTNIKLPEAREILSEIYGIVSGNSSVSVYFTDVDGEYFFGIGENIKYHSASTVKAAYVQYLVATSVDINKKIIFTNSTRSSSSGELNADSIGEEFTVAELIEYAIRNSDNQAYRMLYDTFGIDGYNKYVSSLGLGGLKLYGNDEWAYCSAKDLSGIMREIYRTGLNNELLTEHLKNTLYNEQIPAGTNNITAHKYGYNGKNTGFHDTAIIYAENRPYLLTIMTMLDSKKEETLEVFRSVTELCDRLNEVLYVD